MSKQLDLKYEIKCPKCEANIEISNSELTSKKFICPECGNLITISEEILNTICKIYYKDENITISENEVISNSQIYQCKGITKVEKTKSYFKLLL